MSVDSLDHRFAEVNGLRLHYVTAGRGPLMMFVHGFPEFRYEWRRQLVEFGRDHQAVAPDMRGYNLSGKPAELSQYRVPNMVEDLRALAAHLGRERFVLVGHDWGGVIAWAFAIAHPERLVIAADRAAYLEAWSQPGALTGGLNYYRAAGVGPPGGDGVPARSFGGDVARLIVRVPTLVIWGERDHALLTGNLDGLERFVPDLRIERIPDGSHWVVNEQPERVNRLIRDFLGPHRAAAKEAR